MSRWVQLVLLMIICTPVHVRQKLRHVCLVQTVQQIHGIPILCIHCCVSLVWGGPVDWVRPVVINSLTWLHFTYTVSCEFPNGRLVLRSVYTLKCTPTLFLK